MNPVGWLGIYVIVWALLFGVIPIPERGAGTAAVIVALPVAVHALIVGMVFILRSLGRYLRKILSGDHEK